MRSSLTRVRTRLAHALHPRVHRDSEGDAHYLAGLIGVGSARIEGHSRAFLACDPDGPDPLYVPLDSSEVAGVQEKLRAAQNRVDGRDDEDGLEPGGWFDDWPNAAQDADSTDTGTEERPLGFGRTGPDTEGIETVSVRPGETLRDAMARANRMQAENAEESGEDEDEDRSEDGGIDGTDIPIGSEDRETDASGTEGEEGSP